MGEPAAPRRLAPVALAALLALACGSRTGLAPGGDAGGGDASAGRRDSGTTDAGSRDAGTRDAGARDAGSFDAGPLDAGPFPCTWRALTEPFEVHRHSSGIYERPITLHRGDHYDLLVTYLDPTGRVETYVTQVGVDPPLTWPPIRLEPVTALGAASAAGWSGMVAACVPDRDGRAYLRRYRVEPTYPISSQQPIGAFERCLGAAATESSLLLVASRGGVPHVGVFGPGAGMPFRPALADPSRADPVSVARAGEALAWASPTDGFGRIEVGWVDSAGVRAFEVGGFSRVDGVPPVLAAWPFATDALAILGGSSFGPRLVVVNGDGAELLASGRVPGRMWDLPLPAIARARGGLLLAQLDFGDIDPRAGLLGLHLVGRDGEARELGLPRVAVRRPVDEAGAEVSADGDEDFTVVHWTGVEDGQPVSRALILACE